MMYVDFAAGGTQYKLRLSTRAIIALEKQLGCNPLSIFSDGGAIPTITQMVQVLHASLQQFHHNINMDAAFDIFDAYLADGNSMTDFLPTIVEIYKVSGLIQKDKEVDSEKN